MWILHEILNFSGNGAWTAKSSDFSQFLTIDLRGKRNITAIATQGRPFTSEFVQEFRIEYGNKMLDYSEYKDKEGHTRVWISDNVWSSISLLCYYLESIQLSFSQLHFLINILSETKFYIITKFYNWILYFLQ